MNVKVCAWRDDDFEGVAGLFDALWGWELEGSEQEKRDISDLYVAGAVLECNRLRVIRLEGRVVAFLGSIFYDNSVSGEALYDAQSFRLAAAGMQERLGGTALGRESIDFNDRIVKTNRALEAQMKSRGYVWQAELKLLMTSPAFQGRGLARALIDETLQTMRARGVKGVMLYTDTHCNWRYYEKTGWTLAAEHSWLFRDETIRGLAYFKEL